MGLIGEETGSEYTSYHFDLRGSTVALTNSTGQVTEIFQYSPYGVLLSGDVEKTPFLFNGMYGVMTDSNGLYYMRARFYNPEMRRFVNQDILLGFVEDGQTLNRYAYVTGRPVSFVDPFGLRATLIFYILWDYFTNTQSIDSIAITVINDHSFTGFTAAMVRFGEVYMVDVTSMVNNVLAKAGNLPISRLNILDHSVLLFDNTFGIHLGEDIITLNTLNRYTSELMRLKGHFTDEGFVNLQNCKIGQNFELLKQLSAILGVPIYANDGNYNAFGYAFGQYIRVNPDGTVEVDVELP